MSRVIGWGQAPVAHRERAIDVSRDRHAMSLLGLNTPADRAQRRLQRRFPRLEVTVIDYPGGEGLVAVSRGGGAQLHDCGLFNLRRFDVDAASRAILNRFYTVAP